MKHQWMGQGVAVGLLMVLLACGSGCQDQEKTAVVRGGAGGGGGAGGSPPGQGLGRGGSPGTGGAALPAADAGAPTDATVTPGADASDTGAAIPDVSAPDVVANPQEIYAGKPWSGAALPIPGIIQGEFYDMGGEGIAFHDTDVTNRGNGQTMAMNPPEARFRRTEPVDVSFTALNVDRDPMGANIEANQLYVGWIEPQEWLKYTVTVEETGNYMISSHCAVNSENASISFTFEDGTTTGVLPLPRSGSFRTWHHVDNMAIIKLAAGVHVLRIKFETAGVNLNYISFVRKP